MATLTSARRALIPGATLAALIASQSAGCGEVRYRDTIRTDQSVKRIIIQGDMGVVELVPSESAKVDYAVRAPEGAAHIQHTEFDGVLQVTARCRTPILCSVDAEVHVPANVPVDVELDRGEVWATGIGAIDVSLGEGDVDIETSGRSTVQVGSGTARVVSTNADQVRVAVGQGNIEVLVSPETWNINIVAASESLKGVAHDGDATGALELVAPAGLVSVRALSTLTKR
jgi:hypothetical protein